MEGLTPMKQNYYVINNYFLVSFSIAYVSFSFTLMFLRIVAGSEDFTIMDGTQAFTSAVSHFSNQGSFLFV